MAEHAHAADGQLNGSSPVEQDSSPVEDEHGQADEHVADEYPDENAETRAQERLSRVGPAIAAGVAAAVALGCLAGWLGYRTYETRQTQVLRNQVVHAASQGALNLTTIDYTEAEADIRRILDSSTGAFHDDFQKRSKPFVDVVKRVQSKSEGTVTAAALESQDGDHAQVLVAVSVKTSTIGAPQQEPRAWRMRIGVQKVGDIAKVSDVLFVP
jgi:Mce-associated membrane protein